MSTAVLVVPEVMAAIAAQVKTVLDPVIDGIQVEPGVVSNPTPPCVDVYPGDPFIEKTTFGPGSATEAVFTVRARVVTADQQDGQRLLLQMMDPYGPLSVWAALETDATFGGTVDDSTVENVSGMHPYESAGTGMANYSGSFLGCEWRLRVEL